MGAYTIINSCPVFLAKMVNKISKAEKKRDFVLDSFEEVDIPRGDQPVIRTSVICKVCKIKKTCDRKKHLLVPSKVSLTYKKNKLNLY